jgi:CRISPR/Cas system-associated exonuclease Cas4 (RecB family)
MKTSEQIKNEYIKKVIEFSEAKEAARRVDADGNVKDRSGDIYATDICAWDSYCAKKIYYDKVSKRPPPPEAVIRFTIGHVVHEIPLWEGEEENGHEQAFIWNGLKCRMDEINFKEGIIVDKKTVASIPRVPKDYVIKQLNVYKLIAEENTDRPTKINQLFAINMAVINGFIDVQEIPIWRAEDTKAFIDRMMKEIKYRIENKIPPDVPYKSKGWMCDQCQYTDLCMKDTPSPLGAQSKLGLTSERKPGEGVTIKIGKK